MVRSIVYQNIYKRLLGSVGTGFKINGRITILAPQNLFVGDHVSLNEGVFISCPATIKIGDNVHISPGVIINSGGLNYKNTGSERRHLNKPVEISSGAWVGSGAIINPGVTIGKNAVVGAGSVVTKNVPDDEVWAGVPAKFLKSIHD